MNTFFGKFGGGVKYPENCAEVLCTCPLWHLIPAQYWYEWEIWGNTTLILLLILSLSWLCCKSIPKWVKNEIVGDIFHKILGESITTLTLKRVKPATKNCSNWISTLPAFFVTGDYVAYKGFSKFPLITWRGSGGKSGHVHLRTVKYVRRGRKSVKLYN